jgi:hypothetical protein
MADIACIWTHFADLFRLAFPNPVPSNRHSSK